MYDFCGRLKHLLVGILFRNLHHPYLTLHFEESIFPLVPLTFLAHAQLHPFLWCRAVNEGLQALGFTHAWVEIYALQKICRDHDCTHTRSPLWGWGKWPWCSLLLRDFLARESSGCMRTRYKTNPTFIIQYACCKGKFFSLEEVSSSWSERWRPNQVYIASSKRAVEQKFVGFRVQLDKCSCSPTPLSIINSMHYQVKHKA